MRRENPLLIPLFPEETTELPAGRTLFPEETHSSRENSWEGVEDLESLREKVLLCRDCRLREGARGVVFGEGNPSAHVLLVGEGPGATEDELGRPFVGRAGHLLDAMLRSAGFRRDSVFIANVVKCRPPGNRLPLPDEVVACYPHLKAQIRVINPKIVVCLGALSAQTLIDPSIRVTRDRGRWWTKDSRRYLVTFHPAAVLRDDSKKALLVEDFQELRRVYIELVSGEEGGRRPLLREK